MWELIHRLQARKHKQLCMECGRKMEGEMTVLRPFVLDLFGWCILRLLKKDTPIILFGVFCSDECGDRYAIRKRQEMESRCGCRVILTIAEDD
ncbi:hypothetical protein ES705_40207 [subsurface metagenome]